MKEADIFEQWADRITEGTWALPDTDEQMSRLKKLMSEPLICGPDGEYATEQLYDLIGDDELFDDISVLADRDPNADCRELVKARLADFDIVIDEAVSEGAMSDLHQHIGEMIADGDSNEEIKKMHPGVSDKDIANIRSEMDESVNEGHSHQDIIDQIVDMQPESGDEIIRMAQKLGVPDPAIDDIYQEVLDKISITEDPTQEDPASGYAAGQANAAAGKARSLGMSMGGDNSAVPKTAGGDDVEESMGDSFVNPDEQDGTDDANKISNSEEQDLDDEDMTEVTDIDTGKTALKAERDPMLETELDRLLQLARG